jgi:TolA-binding protein
LSYRGLRAGLYFTEIGAGSAEPDEQVPGSYYFNYSKVAFTLGWQSNIFALLKGDFLQNKAAQLERRRQGLLAQITERQRRIASLELEINRYEAQNLLELEQRRAQAEAELRAEREALRRLEERLKRVEQQNPPRPTPPPTAPQAQPQAPPQTQQQP